MGGLWSAGPAVGCRVDVLGVRPGVVLRVLEREPFGGLLWIEIGGQRRALGTPLARLVHGVARP